MLNPRRLPIFINPENADIEIEAGIFEIVRIAAVKSHLLLGHENNPDVVVTFVTIKMISAALRKRDDVRAQTGFIFAFFFDLRNRVLARLAGGIGRHTDFYRSVYPRGYVFD